MKNTPLCLLPVVFGLALLCGCSNPYAQSYANALSAGAERNLLPHTGTVDIQPVSSGTLSAATQKMEGLGYVVIGRASFNADEGDYAEGLRAKAQEVQADLVLTSLTSLGYRTEVKTQMAINPGGNSGHSTGYVSGSAGGADRSTAAADYGSVVNNAAGGIQENRIAQYRYEAVFLRRKGS